MTKRTKSEAEHDKKRGYTDADLAEVTDNPEWTDAELSSAKTFVEMFPDFAASIEHNQKLQRSRFAKPPRPRNGKR